VRAPPAAARGPVPAASPYASPWPVATPAQAPTRSLELEPDDGGAPLELEGPHVPPSPTPPPSYTSTPLPGADFQGAGVGWRRARTRSPEAQAAFDQALLELSQNLTNRAIASLRRALALAPGDPEIAAQLGKLAFKDRM
jgi:hypothetical protein